MKKKAIPTWETKQQGNALWFILIAIGLLGLLTVMMSRSSSTSNDTGNYEQNIIQANEILSYANSIEHATQSLLARGCSENDISFWHDSDDNGTENGSDDYFNANSPTDRSCHIFNPAGAGMTFITPNNNWLDASHSADFNYNTFIFNSKNQIKNLETDTSDDLLILLEWVHEDVCQALNNIIFSDPTITEDPTDFSYNASADGTFDTIAQEIDLSSYAAHNAQVSACFQSQTNGGNHFYHVLYAR